MSEAQAPLLSVSPSPPQGPSQGPPQGPLQGPLQGSPQGLPQMAGSGLGLARFSQLLIELEQADGTHARQQALQVYFGQAVPSDAAWAAWLLSGERLKRLVPLAVLKQAAMAFTGLPAWAFEECYQSVGDLAETIALLVGQVDEAKASDGSAMASLGLSDWISHRLLPLRTADQAAAQAVIQEGWAQLTPQQVFCLNKLITGGLRVGVSRQMVAAALSAFSGVSRETMATRLIAFTAKLPSADAFTRLLAPAEATEALLGPVPFFLAQSLTLGQEELADPESAATALGQRLGPVEDWTAEWKWDGIRAQVIVRGETVAIWSRGEELVTEMFPELAAAMRLMSQAVDADLLLDGEILVWDAQNQRPQPFAALQTRLGRKKPSARLLQSTPAVFMAYDLLRWSAEDLRPLAFSQRRTRLEAVVREAGLHCPAVMPQLRLSPMLALSSWQEAWRLRGQAQAHFVEGVMLKRQQAAYGLGRQKKTPQGECWKWKRSPFSVDAVLVYAQRGHGRRAGLYTDYGFALWDDRVSPAVLVPFAKAYSGLTDAEIRQVDQVIRKSILEKFGPVRQVAPSLVMELGFEGVMASGRHKSGYAVRFPRILRLRPDKTVAQADCLSALAAFLQVPPEPSR